MTLPMVLEGSSYSRRLHPLECRIEENLQPLSKVDMILPLTDSVSCLEWVKVPKPDGESLYCQVKSVQTDMTTGEKTVYLEHGACTLDDVMVPEENTKEPMKWTKPANQLIADILAKQARWTSGTIDATDAVTIEPGDQTLMTLLLSVMKSLPDYQIEFIQTDENDWHIDVKLRPETVICEGRLSRNLESCIVSYDAKAICTRIYCEGLTGGKMDSANIATYGLHEEVKRLSDDLDVSDKEAICSSYLSNHDHPVIGIEISGQELSQITGLAIDKFAVGKRCRIAIPWLGVTESEIVTSKTYNDAYADPQSVKVILSNQIEDLSLIMASVSGGGQGVSASLAAKQAFYASFINGTNKELQSVVQQSGISLEDTFDPTATYAEGDTVVCQGKSYRFTAAHQGPWTGVDAVQITLQSQIYEESNLTNGTTKATYIRSEDLAADKLQMAGKNLTNTTITIDGTTYNIVTWSDINNN